MRSPSIEIRIPISPNEHFLRMLRIFAASLHQYGGPLGRSARIVASVGADEAPRDLAAENEWASRYAVTFRWVPREEFRRHEYEATGFDRFNVQSNADIVILADADIFIAGDFDRLIRKAYQLQTLYGAIAHISPFRTPRYRHRSSAYWWGRLFRSAGLPPPELNWQYSAWGNEVKDPNHRVCPPYFNFGFIISPRSHIEQIGRTFVADLAVVDSVLDTWFKSQIANTLSIVRNNVPASELSIKYNFPLNQPSREFMERNPDPDGENQVEQITIFHYLGEGEINKNHFLTKASVHTLLARTDLSPAAHILQHKLRTVISTFDEFQPWYA